LPLFRKIWKPGKVVELKYGWRKVGEKAGGLARVMGLYFPEKLLCLPAVINVITLPVRGRITDLQYSY